MQPGGRVVNIASIAGVLGLKNRIAYSTTKAGMIGMTRRWRSSSARAGICVNAIGPGVIETSLTASYFEDEAFATLIRDNVPLGRWGQTSDLHGAGGLPLRTGRGVRQRAGAVRRRRVGRGEGVLRP